jgi:hypothetical protein
MNKLQKLTTNISNVIAFGKEGILNGDIDPREALKLQKLTKEIETLTKNKKVKEMLLNELKKYPEGTGVYEGIEWVYKNGSGKYKYEQDGEYAALKEQRDKFDELMKQRADLLKTATKYYEQGRELVVDGEVISPVAFVQYSDSVSIK